MVAVSLLLPTKDRPDRLERAVAAILSQGFEDFELIIENGGGPIPTFTDERIQVLKRPDWLVEGGGVLNHAASVSQGRWMHITADDDVIQPGTIEDAIYVPTDWTYGTMQFYRDGQLHEVVGSAVWSIPAMTAWNIVFAPTVFWTREIWERCGPFDERIKYVWDYEMWARFGADSEPTVRSHVDYHYELWAGSTSSMKQWEVREEVKVVQGWWQQVGFGNRPCVMCPKVATEQFGACEEHFVAARARANCLQ